MELKNIILDRKDGIATLKLNRPDMLNALNHSIWFDLDVALDEVQNDSGIKVLLLTGEGKAFSTGDDPTDFKELNSADIRRYLADQQQVFRRILRFEKPTIAVINGYALGSGCELSLTCDIRIAADEAQIGLPEARRISTLKGGASRTIQALIGPGKAFELLYTGDYISGREAQQIGLVNRSVPLPDLMTEALALAAKIAANPTDSLKAIKSAQLMAQEPISLDALLDYEVEARLVCIAAQKSVQASADFEDRKK